MRDNLKSRISHIFRLHLSYCFFPFITNATFSSFYQAALCLTTNRHLYARKHSRAFYQAALPYYLSRIQTIALQWTDHCTIVNSSIYSSEWFYPLTWNERNVALIIWKERQSRIRLQSIHLWNSTANDTNRHKKRANPSALP